MKAGKVLLLFLVSAGLAVDVGCRRRQVEEKAEFERYKEVQVVGTTVVYGRVVDRYTGKPIKDVVVKSLHFGKVGTRTDEDGYFRLNDVPVVLGAQEISKIREKLLDVNRYEVRTTQPIAGRYQTFNVAVNVPVRLLFEHPDFAPVRAEFNVALNITVVQSDPNLAFEIVDIRILEPTPFDVGTITLIPYVSEFTGKVVARDENGNPVPVSQVTVLIIPDQTAIINPLGAPFNIPQPNVNTFVDFALAVQMTDEQGMFRFTKEDGIPAYESLFIVAFPFSTPVTTEWGPVFKYDAVIQGLNLSPTGAGLMGFRKMEKGEGVEVVQARPFVLSLAQPSPNIAIIYSCVNNGETVYARELSGCVVLFNRPLQAYEFVLVSWNGETIPVEVDASMNPLFVITPRKALEPNPQGMPYNLIMNVKDYTTQTALFNIQFEIYNPEREYLPIPQPRFRVPAGWTVRSDFDSVLFGPTPEEVRRFSFPATRIWIEWDYNAEAVTYVIYIRTRGSTDWRELNSIPGCSYNVFIDGPNPVDGTFNLGFNPYAFVNLQCLSYGVIDPRTGNFVEGTTGFLFGGQEVQLVVVPVNRNNVQSPIEEGAPMLVLRDEIGAIVRQTSFNNVAYVDRVTFVMSEPISSVTVTKESGLFDLEVFPLDMTPPAAFRVVRVQLKGTETTLTQDALAGQRVIRVQSVDNAFVGGQVIVGGEPRRNIVAISQGFVVADAGVGTLRTSGTPVTFSVITSGDDVIYNQTLTAVTDVSLDYIIIESAVAPNFATAITIGGEMANILGIFNAGDDIYVLRIGRAGTTYPLANAYAQGTQVTLYNTATGQSEVATLAFAYPLLFVSSANDLELDVTITVSNTRTQRFQVKGAGTIGPYTFIAVDSMPTGIDTVGNERVYSSDNAGNTTAVRPADIIRIEAIDFSGNRSAVKVRGDGRIEVESQ